MKRLPALLLAMMAAGTILIPLSSCEQAVTEGTNSPELGTPQIALQKQTEVMFTGVEDHTISLDIANQMTSMFQKNNPYDAYAWYFSREAIEKLLAQEGCVGIRIYGGLKSDSEFSPVIYGVNAPGADFIGSGLSKALLDSLVGPMEIAMPCPPFCGTPP